MTAPIIGEGVAPGESGDEVSAGVVPEAALLSKIYYPPVASVTIAYPNDAFKVFVLNYCSIDPLKQLYHS